MKPESKELYKNLESSLDELIKVYRHILGIVRNEKNILISAKLDELNANNKSKELMLVKAGQLELERQKSAAALAKSEGLFENAKLSDFAYHLGGSEGYRLKNMQSVLELLLKRVRDYNTQNEILVKSALDNVTGAIGSIKDTLADKPTYKKTGGTTARPAGVGQLVSKEA